MPVLDNCTGGSSVTTLQLAQPQSVAGGYDFYIYLPAGTYSGLRIVLYQSDGSYCPLRGNITIQRSACHCINLNDLSFENPDLLNGLFSVDADGHKVRFSRGNLQYVDGTWRFAEHQYDCRAYYDANVCDLFFWSNNNSSYGADIVYSATAGLLYLNWGAAINSDGADGPWKTLSNDEWHYLLSDNGQRAGKFGLATINVGDPGNSNQVFGLVILPDDWQQLSSLPSFSATGVVNQYSADEWNRMESAGAVFLPAAGSRPYSNGEVILVGLYGYYWSSTPGILANSAYDVSFSSAGVDAGSAFENNRTNALSVRLVQHN